MPAPTQKLRINVKISQFLADYIDSYPNVLGIFEVGEGYVTIYTTMTSAQISQFKTDVTNRLMEILPA